MNDATNPSQFATKLSQDEFKECFELVVAAYSEIVKEPSLYPDKTFGEVALEAAKNAGLPTFCTPTELLRYLSRFKAFPPHSITAFNAWHDAWTQYSVIAEAQEVFNNA